MDLFLKDKVVAITGASSGIGKALADIALAGGASVALCARNLSRLESAFPDRFSGRLLLVQADVAIEEDCGRFVAAIVSAWGRIDILINNAGMSMRALFADLELKVLKELMDVNFWGTVYMTKHALPYLKAARGTIAGISSIAGYRGLPGRTGYSSSKFAMQGFLEALRTELLHTGVHVMWAAPGFTASNIRNVALGAQGDAQKETPLDEKQLMSAEACANLIWKGVQKRKRTIVMTTQGKATVWLNKLFPGMMDKMVFNHFAKEPGSPLKK
ncbi:SDR family oxidoreductase [Taibaiella koreensis]|uniref:SDR family oxidoreductase n=1 Tax=Taibaiella koreensis TaxID=1268548 RepID=UPI000E59B448|nr:SDR family oxidoreductase [Taibaiella koreensis]